MLSLTSGIVFVTLIFIYCFVRLQLCTWCQNRFSSAVYRGVKLRHVRRACVERDGFDINNINIVDVFFSNPNLIEIRSDARFRHM
jgi:hypothetical protein